MPVKIIRSIIHGREGSIYALEAYTEVKAVYIQL